MALRLPLLFAAALAAGASYTANHWLGLEGPAAIAWKGSGVGLLALWAALAVRTPDGQLIAAALALGALGDMLLNAVSLTVGAIAFLAGHVVASILYLRHRRLPLVLAAWLAEGWRCSHMRCPTTARRRRESRCTRSGWGRCSARR